MTTQLIHEALSTLPLVRGLPPHHVDKLAALATEAGFERDQVIFQEGEAHDRFYILLSGKVALEVPARERVFRVQTLQEGDEFGWSSVLADEKKHFQARALERVRVLAFDGEGLQRACRDDVTFGFAFFSRLLRVVSSRLQATRLHLLEIYASQV